MGRDMPPAALCHLAAAVLCGAMLIHGVRTSSDLEWPPDPDHFRDIAQAQTMQDGAWLEDPFYRGESSWYNPLLASTLAALSTITGHPIHVVDTRAGAYLNVAAPVTFYILALRLMPPGAALAALAGLLFVVRGPTWATPGYSPWLYASIFAQPLFYLTLAAYCAAIAADRWWRHLGVGVLLGATFLAHTAPAIVAGVCIVAVAAYRAVVERHPGRTLARELALTLVPAALMALPVLWSIVGRYQVRIKNPIPLMWRDLSLPPDLWQMVWQTAVSNWPAKAVILFGFAVFLLNRLKRRTAVVVTAWLGASVLFFLYNQYAIVDAADQIASQPTVPAHHFLVYGRALEMVLFGQGVFAATTAAGWIAWRVLRGRFALHACQSAVYAVVIVAIVASNYPAFLARAAFVGEREAARVGFTTPELRAIVPWIRTNSVPSDVFLTSDSACLSIIGPAGRKCVMAPRFFSNPYVDWIVRRDAHRSLWDALGADDCATFRAQADAYAVTFIMTVDSRTPQLPAGRCGLLPTTFPGSTRRIYRVPAS
jgi:hypothetical protein